MIPQRTLKNTIRATGVGLHTGEVTVVTLKAAPPDHGIVFTRTDLTPAVRVAAMVDNVCDTQLATTLMTDGVRVAAVEHVMSAFFGLGIDNAEVELDGEEMPVMDGSAAPFVFLIQSAGAVEQASSRRYLRVLKETACRAGESVASLSPYDGCRIEYRDDEQRHRAVFDLSTTAYIREVSRARTFGFLADADQLETLDFGADRAADAADPASDATDPASDATDPAPDATVASGERPGDSSLRLDDEFARHRILDAMGDLYLLGHSVLGHYRGWKSGHTCNNALVRAVLSDPDGYELVTLDSEDAVSPEVSSASAHR